MTTTERTRIQRGLGQLAAALSALPKAESETLMRALHAKDVHLWSAMHALDSILRHAQYGLPITPTTTTTTQDPT